MTWQCSSKSGTCHSSHTHSHTPLTRETRSLLIERHSESLRLVQLCCMAHARSNRLKLSPVGEDWVWGQLTGAGRALSVQRLCYAMTDRGIWDTAAFRSALGRWIPGAVCLAIKQPQREADPHFRTALMFRIRRTIPQLTFFYVLLTVHLSIILVINQLNAQILVLYIIRFIICLHMFRALCAHHQEVKIVLYSIWYHHTCRWPSRPVLSQPAHRTATYRCDDTRCCIIQFDLLMMSTTVLETCRGI